MSSTSAPYERRSCHSALQADEAVVLVDVRSGRVSWLCRPLGRSTCFLRSARSRDGESIGRVAGESTP